MAIESLIPPKSYTIDGLIRSLEKPEHRGFEAQIAGTMREQGLDAEFEPAWKLSQALALPDRRLVRALGATGDATTGADLTFASLAEVAEAARPALVLDALGVPRREVAGAATLDFPVEQPFAIGGWQGENATGASLTPTIESVTAAPRQSISYVEFSRRLRLQAIRVEDDILGMLRRATLATLERGFLQGTGTENQPAGLFTVQAKGAEPFAGSAPTRTELLAMLADYVAAEGRVDRAAWICDGAMALGLMAAEAGTASGRYLLEPDAAGNPRILGRPVGITNHAPAGKLMLFDPQSCRTVFWGPAFALLDKYSLDTSGGSRMLIYNLCDVVALRPEQIIIGGAA
jgi:HK97 family phage major capsid protein